MSMHQFIASSAEDAARQIRERLGPQAVVVQVRRQPARWFRRARWEVLAHVPPVPPANPVACAAAASNDVAVAPTTAERPACGPVGRGTGDLLESLGVLPVYAEPLRQRFGLGAGVGA
ncbi:MAG: hypothetical protein N3A53_01960, partial [Verrucomicrobiae bacterium]|nr:hypothetical protein [Verrucomicrobiae bacterium]